MKPYVENIFDEIDLFKSFLTFSLYESALDMEIKEQPPILQSHLQPIPNLRQFIVVSILLFI